MSASFSNRALGTNWARTQASQEKLSSGSRINRGADDAAGLAVSEKNRASIRSLGAAVRNLQDGFVLAETANGALSQIGNIVIRLRELAIQASSDTYGDEERGMIEAEASGLYEEIDRISNNTDFNGVPLLNGTGKRLEIQADSGHDAISSRISVEPRVFEATPERLGLANFSLRDRHVARASLDRLDHAQQIISDARTSVGAFQLRLEACRDNVLNYRNNITAARSRVKDTDFAEESSEVVKNSIITNSNAAVHSQANQSTGVSLKLLK